MEYDLATHDDVRRIYHDNPSVTLDGKEAVIAGWRNDYPTVVTLDGKIRADFSRKTVAAVLTTNGGRFTT